jgi:hypothetical protein
MGKEYPLLLKPFLALKAATGIKTETRRVIKPEWSRCLDLDDPDDIVKAIAGNPYGQPGGILWVRETWRHDFINVHQGYTAVGISYKAGGCGINMDLREQDHRDRAKREMKHGSAWRPNIFMPRYYCRTTLRIKEVLVEKVRDIRTTAIIAEGLEIPDVDYTVPDDPRTLDYERDCYAYDLFGKTWDEINASRGFPWKDNPHVFVVKFEVHETAVHT